MSFDEIPENSHEEYPCPDCDNGNVSSDDNGHTWTCDKCDFERRTID